MSGRQGNLPFGDDFGESGTQEKHHFTSYERDTQAGTDYAVNRQYAQNTARFNRPDPLGAYGKKESPQSWNRYLYSVNDPINLKDPRGLFADGWGWPEEDPCDPLGATVTIDGIESLGDLFCIEELPPSEVSPDPDPAPAPCNINVRVTGRQRSHFDASSANVPNVGGRLGEGETSPSDGDWYFFYEIEVFIPRYGGSNNDWVFSQSVVFRSLVTMKLPDGSLHNLSKNEEKPDDNPASQFTEWSNGNYYWTDIPSRSKVDHFGHVLGNVIAADVTWDFVFEAINKRDPRRSCSTEWVLNLSFTDGVASWTSHTVF